MIVSGSPMSDTSVVDVQVNDVDSLETIETRSAEGQEILIEAIRLLEERIGKSARQAHEPTQIAAFDNYQ